MTAIESKELRRKVKKNIDHVDDRTVKVVYAMLEAVDVEDNKESEEAMWKDVSAQNFVKGYGADEPVYSQADIKEPNREFKGWKGK